jgi:hypothetical protein
MRRRQVLRYSAIGVVGVVAAVTAIGACSGSGSSSRSGSALRPVRAEASAAVSGAVAGGQRTGVFGDASHAGPGLPANAPTPTQKVASYKIRIADLTVVVSKASDVAAQADRADAIAARYGGEVYGDQRTSGKEASAVITLKVPPGALPRVLRDLSALGKEKSRAESTKDVTGDVIDIDARVKALQKMITTLEALVDPSRRLSDLIALEQQISDRQAELESLQAQQRALHAQTDTATVTLTLVSKAVAHHHKKAGGFLGGLRKGWDAFVRGANAVALGLGAAIPFAVLLVVLALVLRLLWPRIGRRVAPTPAPAPAGE